jgi:hypothetical protein
MKNTMKILGIIALVAVIIFSAVACFGKGDKEATDDPSVVLTSTDLDLIIDEYEVVVTDFVAVFNKMMEGDLTVADEMAELEAKLEALYDQMAPYEETATEEQIQRITDITAILEFDL